MSLRERLDFVRLWNTSDSLDDVCEACGLSRLAASVKAARLRQRGVVMIPFARGRARRYGGNRRHKSTSARLLALTPEKLERQMAKLFNFDARGILETVATSPTFSSAAMQLGMSRKQLLSHMDKIRLATRCAANAKEDQAEHAPARIGDWSKLDDPED